MYIHSKYPTLYLEDKAWGWPTKDKCESLSHHVHNHKKIMMDILYYVNSFDMMSFLTPSMLISYFLKTW